MKLKGMKIGKLEVLRTTKNDTNKVDCKCDCGKEIAINRVSLQNGFVTSCGCDAKNQVNKEDLKNKLLKRTYDMFVNLKELDSFIEFTKERFELQEKEFNKLLYRLQNTNDDKEILSYAKQMKEYHSSRNRYFEIHEYLTRLNDFVKKELPIDYLIKISR